jgi:eukaryotic-like serine/threonine-protein kinase
VKELRGIDRYELVRALGSGGSGTVFEARDRLTGARLAIKSLNQSAGATLYHFKQEFRIVSELSHPFLVRFGELFEDAGKFYLTMELVEGQTFLDFVRPGRRALPTPFGDARAYSGVVETLPFSPPSPPSPLSPLLDDRPHRRALGWPPVSAAHSGGLDPDRLRLALKQLSSGLIALHASGVIHRDVKPANVLVNNEERVVVLDFGVAVFKDRAHPADVAGTMGYMAPEQVAGLPVTEAVDWYAVGVMLYESLTGRLPYLGVPPWSSARKSAPPRPVPARGDPELPDDLCVLCLGLLAYDPEHRPREGDIVRTLGIDAEVEKRRASFRSQLHFSRDFFVNRTSEIEVLDEARQRARREGCTIVRIVGESGVGKTALLRRWLVALEAGADDCLVLSGRCYERETLPYRGLDGVIDSLARAHNGSARRAMPAPRDAALLGLVFPVLREVYDLDASSPADRPDQDPHEVRRLAFSALRELLTGLAASSRTVVHIDDAQWIDRESVALLSFLVVGETPPELLFVFTERPTGSDLLAEVVASARAVVSLELGPLGAHASRQLATELFRRRGAPSAALAEAAARKSGGHPLFIHELVLHGDPVGSTGTSLEEALSARIAKLEPAFGRLIELVAIAYSPLPHDVIRAAAALDPIAYPRALSALRSENLVAFQGLSGDDDVQPYHDRIRELVVVGLGEGPRRECHARLAASIEEHAPHLLDALAHHFFEAGGRDKAARFAGAAAERALQQLAFEHAARFFELALRAEDRADARGRLEARLGQALANAGRGVESAEAYMRAARASESIPAHELRRRAGEQLFRAGHVERAMEILSEILRELGVPAPRTDLQTTISLLRVLARLQVRLQLGGLRFEPRPESEVTATERLRLDACWTVASGLSMVHHLRATLFQARSLLLALDVGDPDRILHDAALLSVSLGASGTMGRKIANRLMAFARELADRFPSPENTAWLELTSGAAAMGDWEFDRCVTLCDRAEATLRARCTGVAWEVASAQAFALWAMAFRGDFEQAAARLPELLASARARGDRHAIATLTLSPLHLVSLAADGPAQARADCVAALGEWPETFACFQHMCAAYVLCHVDLYEGNPRQAWDHATRAWHMLQRSHLSRVEFQRIDLLSLRARVACALAASPGADPARWRASTERDAERLERIQTAPALAFAALVRGSASCAAGRGREAADRLAVAARLFDGLAMRMHAASSRLGAALAIGDPRAARAAEAELTGLGVVRPLRMLGLWVPGVRP